MDGRDPAAPTPAAPVPGAPRPPLGEPASDRSLEVAPTPVGRAPARAGVLALAVVALAVLAGVVRPWGGEAGPRPPGASGDASPVATPGPSVPGTLPPPHSPFPRPATAADLLAATGGRDAAGLRFVVVPAGGEPAGDGSGGGLLERWLPAGPGGLLGDRGGPGPRDTVLALGATTASDLLLDLRIWRTDPAGGRHLLAPVPLPGPEPGSLLWLPDPSFRTEAGAWPGGWYLVELLGASGEITEQEVELPGPYGRVDPAVTPGWPADVEAALAALPDGPFVLGADGVVPLRVRPPDGEDWLTPGDLWIAAAEPLHPRRLPLVARVAGAVGAVGAVLTAGPETDLEVSQDTGPSAYPVAWEVSRLEVGPGRMAWIARPARGGVLPTGLHHWYLVDAPVVAAWWAEIVPPGFPPPSLPVRALAAWRTDGRLAVEGLAGTSVLETAALPAAGAACTPRSTIAAGGSSLLALAVTGPGGAPVARVRLVAEDGRALPTRLAASGEDGLALLALDAADLVPGRYRLEIRHGYLSGVGDGDHLVCVS